ncbi:MAG: pyridoxamine 5'-phosphate oxidase family protein [Rhodospirillales bacterium]|nr:pyridoxamine 5'-phosphate oxidase family protein [Rhodospirillales bacterium]
MSLSDQELKSAIGELLQRHTVLALATVGEQGPHGVSLMYAYDEFTLYWLSDPKTRHSQDLNGKAPATVTVAGQYGDFKEIQGLQLKGFGERLENGVEEKNAFKLLGDRYEFLKTFSLGNLARHLGAAAVYVFRPSSITLIDNKRGFGFKQTLNIEN